MEAERQQKASVPGTPFKPGQNSRTLRRDKVALKFAELERAYFPNGGMGTMDGVRLSLVAKHFVDAELCRDPLLAQRATRLGEYLLNKLTPPPKAKPVSAFDEYVAKRQAERDGE